jgi:hypothetical protein
LQARVDLRIKINLNLQASKILLSLLFQANYFPIAIVFFPTRIARQSAGKAFPADRRVISQHLSPGAFLAEDHLGCKRKASGNVL